jgi:serine beta-lactamase-like protein LACTB
MKSVFFFRISLRYYLRDEKKRLVNVPYVDNSYKWGGGGILSNVTDLCKLGNKLIYYYQSSDTVDEKKFLKASTMRSQVWSTQSKPERSADREVFFEHDYDVTYGLGWNLCFDRNRDLKYVYHTGGAVGATSCLLIAPNNKSNYNEKTDTHTPNGVCVAVLCNSQDVGDIVKFSYLISKIFADESNEY